LWSVKYGHEDMAKYLLSVGADIEVNGYTGVNEFERCTPLTVLVLVFYLPAIF
jgi:hypothetical protein